MKIFIDFDDVLFNTKKFILEYLKIFKQYGISEEIFKKYYYGEKRMNNGSKKYDFKKHLKRINRDFKIDIKNLESDINKFLFNTEKFIFKDVKKTLGNFKNDNLYILSYGDNKFQNKKIKNSGIADYFKKIIISQKKNKSFSLKEKKPFYFLDDRAAHLKDIKKSYPFATTILVKRKEGRYNDNKNKHRDFEVKNLSEARKIIQSRYF